MTFLPVLFAVVAKGFVGKGMSFFYELISASIKGAVVLKV